MKLYAIVDRKAKSIVNTFASVSDEAAERSFLMLLTGPRNIYTDFPEDFELFPVAELTFENSVLTVGAHGTENLIKNGFKVDTFSVVEALKRGVDYGKAYLDTLSAERMRIYEAMHKEETSDEA